MTIVVTGHTGFVGQSLVKALANRSLRLVGRRVLKDQPGEFFRKSLDDKEDYSDCLQGADIVIHAAARVHVMNDSAIDPLEEYRATNVAGTLNFAKQAASKGVKRFIYISSIKVNGESTLAGTAFTAFDPPAPSDAYGLSKAEAEYALKQLSSKTGMEVVIIRPPLVYGPGVKANFSAMLKISCKNLPLPLGAINNKRSLVAVDNLIDLIVTCINHPNAANQTFLVSDDRDISTTELLKMMTEAAGQKPRLLPMPVSWLKFIGTLTGKQSVIERLCGNLQVDITHTKYTLDWTPPITVNEGIKRCI